MNSYGAAGGQNEDLEQLTRQHEQDQAQYQKFFEDSQKGQLDQEAFDAFHKGVMDRHDARDGKGSSGGGLSFLGKNERQQAQENAIRNRMGRDAAAGAAGLNALEQNAFKRNKTPEKLGKGYTGKGDKGKDKAQEEGGRLKRFGSKAKNFFKKRRKGLVLGTGGFLIIGGLIAASGSILPWKLHHIMDNINTKTFARLNNVDMRGRSSKWLKAYMTARMMDITDPAHPDADDNVLFRSNRVDKNNPFYDWYRTLRTSRFEKDIFEQYGIKFTSSFYHNGNRLVVRPAKITVNDTELTFDPFDGPDKIDPAVLERAINGDVSAFNEIDRLTGKADQFIQKEFFDDKTARKEIKDVLKKMLPANNFRFWNAFRRYFLRKNIQNMIGVRDWSFWEVGFTTKNGNKINGNAVRDWYAETINKILDKALPENLKIGKFFRCMTGVDNCRASTDPESPDNKTLPDDGTTKSGEKTDKDGKPIADSDSAEGVVADALASTELSDTAKKIAVAIGKKGNLALIIVSLVQALANFDESVHNGSISKMVTAAREQQVTALYATYQTANDQLYTGQVNPDGNEVNAFMGTLDDTTNTEGWSTVVNEQPDVVHADGFLPTTNKKVYCSAEHQSMLDQYPNSPAALNEFKHNCVPVGGATNFDAFAAAWDAATGFFLHPMLVAFNATAGALLNLFDALTSWATEAITQTILTVLHLQQPLQDFVAWAEAKILEWGGGGPLWSAVSLARTVVNYLIQGGAVSAELAARGQGAALSTPETIQDYTTRNAAVIKSDIAQESIAYRYFSLNNPQSLASNALFAVVDKPPSQWAYSILGSMGNLLGAPLKIISQTTHAAAALPNDSPYVAAQTLAQIDTYDLPAVCLDAKVIGTTPQTDPAHPENWALTPQTATNAVQLGIFKPEELTWDLMTDTDRWYAELYKRVDNDTNRANQVYNCALNENAVAGSIGGPYGYKGVGALSTSNAVAK